LIANWTLQSLLAALFAIQAILKLDGSQAWITRFRAWGYPGHFYLVVGLAEASGAILLLIPRLAKFGVQLLIGVMVGAAATHLIHHEPQVVTTLVLAVLILLVCICGKEQIQALRKPLKRSSRHIGNDSTRKTMSLVSGRCRMRNLPRTPERSPRMAIPSTRAYPQS